MLIITRRVGENFLLFPDASLDPHMTVAELFASGPLEIGVLGVKGNQVRVGIDAPTSIHIIRRELQPNSDLHDAVESIA